MTRRETTWAALALISSAGTRALAGLPNTNTPIGLWRTYSDKDGRESGEVRIAARGDVLVGSVAAILDPAKRNRVCEKCRDERHGQPVLGMEILRGMRPDGDRWTGGEILDPEEGATYRCTMHLENAGRALVVRGFIGLAMFGRSQRWLRLG